MSDLKIARGFALPLDLVTEATAIVATRGAGTTATCCSHPSIGGVCDDFVR